MSGLTAICHAWKRKGRTSHEDPETENESYKVPKYITIKIFENIEYYFEESDILKEKEHLNLLKTYINENPSIPTNLLILVPLWLLMGTVVHGRTDSTVNCNCYANCSQHAHLSTVRNNFFSLIFRLYFNRPSIIDLNLIIDSANIKKKSKKILLYWQYCNLM